MFKILTEFFNGLFFSYKPDCYFSMVCSFFIFVVKLRKFLTFLAFCIVCVPFFPIFHRRFFVQPLQLSVDPDVPQLNYILSVNCSMIHPSTTFFLSHTIVNERARERVGT
uniref:Uncharacterized protein n=1 Tax=Cacopsylla melanoneura TaxID=428564 RepID=A0A8D8Z060_9HEMI